MQAPEKETREMFVELSSLMVQIARSLGLREREVADLFDEDQLKLHLGTDPDGKHFVSVRYGEKSIRIYKSSM